LSAEARLKRLAVTPRGVRGMAIWKALPSGVFGGSCSGKSSAGSHFNPALTGVSS
jgi:lipoprotein